MMADCGASSTSSNSTGFEGNATRPDVTGSRDLNEAITPGPAKWREAFGPTSTPLSTAARSGKGQHGGHDWELAATSSASEGTPARSKPSGLPLENTSP